MLVSKDRETRTEKKATKPEKGNPSAGTLGPSSRLRKSVQGWGPLETPTSGLKQLHQTKKKPTTTSGFLKEAQEPAVVGAGADQGCNYRVEHLQGKAIPKQAGVTEGANCGLPTHSLIAESKAFKHQSAKLHI